MIIVSSIYSDVSKQGLGNRLFQYCWARDIAEQKAYKLVCDPILGFPITYSSLDGEEKQNNVAITPEATQLFDMNKILNHNGQIIVSGYPQRYSYYIHNKEKIKNWLKIENEENYEKPNIDDLVLNIRLGDYVSLGWDLDIDYYVKILKRETYNKAIIICDEPNHPKLEVLKQMGCIIKDNTSHGNLKFIADFVYVKHAKKCVISNSTFSWWATFLGDGLVYFPLLKYPWNNNPSENDVDLRVYDENRYIFVVNEKK